MPYVVVETLTRVAPFGLAFWDDALGRLVSEDIAVRLFAMAGARATSPVRAVPNRADVFVAHGLAGQRAFEFGAGDDDFWATLWPTQPYLVEVVDARSRYMPFVMALRLPAPRGRAMPACVDDMWPRLIESPLGSPMAAPTPASVPLFSTSARMVPAGMAVVRATLVDAETRRPAEYAMLEIRSLGRLLSRGVADARGEVAALFAYPEPATPTPTSPPSSPPSPPLSAQTWTLDVTVRYRRDLARYSPDPARPPVAELCELLHQPLATLSTASPPAALTEATLRYGEDLVLGADAGAELFISPA